MNTINVFYFLSVLSILHASGLKSLQVLFYKTIASSAIYDITNTEKSLSKRSRTKFFACDENKLMLSLANIQVISPERVILILTKYETSTEVCDKLTTTIRIIENDQNNCNPLDGENLYNMLFRSLKMFELVFCMDKQYQKIFDKNADCIRQLREEYIDCEGPADWCELSNRTATCETFINIAECDYIKTAEVCGLDVGKMLYCILTKVIVASLEDSCGMPKKLPKIRTFAVKVAGASCSSSRLQPLNILMIILITSFR